MNHKKLAIVLCGLIVIVGFAFGTYRHLDQRAQTLTGLAQEADSVFNRPHSPRYGAKEAKVQIVEFFDPACETCRAFYPIVKAMVDARPGQVQLVLRYLPLHHGSDVAVGILEAARLQGMFWPVTEATLRAQAQWAAHDAPNPERIWPLLAGSGLDLQKAGADATSPAVMAVMSQDIADAKALKVTRTPGFFVNGRPLTDFGVDQLKALVDDEIRRAYPN